MPLDERDIFAPAPLIDAALERCVDGLSQPGPQREAMRYATLGGGKRLRPVLAWHCAEAMGARGEFSLPAGVALELVHCFSLVHDDLPALDNDDLRRGKPTLHKHAGEAMAILAGDALLTLASEHLAMQEHIGPHLRIALVRELTRATSLMIQGQTWDTLGGLPDAMPPADRLLLIHRHKTGALIEASCRMGAMLGRADDHAPAIAPITAYAQAIGVLFQVVDDLLDVTQTAEHTGKRTGKDEAMGKLTYPVIFGVDGTHRKARELHAQAHEAIAPLGPRGTMLAALADFVASRTK